MERVELHVDDDGVVFGVKASPGAARTRVSGVWNGALKAAVSAPPEGGKANAAILKLLAKTLGVRASALTLVAGDRNPQKRFRVAGLSQEAVAERLESALPDG